MPEQLLLMSIKPEYAEMLFSGRKTVELRRVRPAVRGGDWVLVYASSPRKALLGAFQVECVVEAHPGEIWERLGAQTGISHEAFHDYFEGSLSGVAIHVGETVRFAEPPSLDKIRESIPGFHPPQCYSYLAAGSVTHEAMLELVPSASQSAIG